jgi:hypothetical protein
VRDCPNCLGVTKSDDEPAVHELEDTPFRLHRRVPPDSAHGASVDCQVGTGPTGILLRKGMVRIASGPKCSTVSWRRAKRTGQAPPYNPRRDGFDARHAPRHVCHRCATRRGWRRLRLRGGL